MPNERFTRGSAVSDGFEVPSDQAELVIILRNVAGGEPVIWRREDDRTDDKVSWIATLLSWGFEG
jgi:hypothetical protein